MPRTWGNSIADFASRFRSTAAAFGSGVAHILDLARILHGLEFVFLALFVLVPTWPLVELINWSLARQSPVPGLVVVSISAVLLIVWAGLISNESVLRQLDVQRFRWPTVFSVALAWVALVVFGGATCSLQRIGLVEIEPVVSYADDCATKYADLYLWHLLDSIPVIKFTDTVQWTPKYEYSDRVSGWLLLAFKLIVVVPAIGSFVALSRVRRGQDKDQP